MLAIDLASITGTVFNDLDNDGVYEPGAGETGIQGVSVSLTGTDTNGAVNLNATTAADGSYRFDGLLEGSYQVTQVPPPPGGFLSNPGGSPASVTISATDVMGVVGTTIDAFNGTAQSVTAMLPGGNPSSSSAIDGQTIGGTRDFFVNVTSTLGQATLSSNVPTNPGVLDSISASNTTAVYTTTWDGDSDPLTLNHIGLGGVDLTDGGASTALQVMAGVDRANQTISVRAYTDAANWSQATVAVLDTAGVPSDEILIPFATGFTIGGGSGADFSNVGAIQLDYTSTDPGAEFVVDMFRSIGPTGFVRDFANLVTAPAIDIEKATDGQDADTPTGPLVPVGATVNFTYAVANTGDTALSNVTVTDDNGTPGTPGDDLNPAPVLNGGFNVGDTNTNGALDVGETWQYTASRTATAGQYTNTATASGVDSGSTQVTDQDPSNHFGFNLGIDIEKATNGQDADTAAGPQVPVGSTATFTYQVSNTGNLGLNNIAVTDDNGTPSDATDDFNPAPVLSGAFNVGDTNMDNILDTTEVWQFTASRTVTAGQYTNTASVTGEGPAAAQVTDQDPSNHFGLAPGINIEKATDGQDADTPTGPQVPVGSTVTFTYAVRNTGNTGLTNVTVTDDNGTPGDGTDDFNPAPVLNGAFNVGDTNTDNTLDLTEVWQYTATRTVTAGQFTNIATATGEDAAATAVNDQDTSNHFGLNLGIDIQKATNGQDADTPTGPQVLVGSTATFTYQVSNSGNAGLTNVVVTDDNGTPGDATDDFNPAAVLNGAFNIGDTNMNNTLDTTEVWQYSATRTVTAGQHTNTSSVSGEGPTGSQVTDQDASNHLGLTEGINIEKSTNGQDADSATGPLVAVGSTVNFAYLVSNTGGTGITAIVVTDDNGTPGDASDDLNPAPVLNGAFNVGDTNMDNTLDTTETWQYTATRTVTAGQFTNVATVTGMGQGAVPVSDQDPSNHFGLAPGINIEKATDGQDADTPTGPQVPVGSTVTFTYEVRNAGNTGLTNVTVTDDNGTPGSATDDFNPAPVLNGAFNVGDTNMDNTLDLTEVWKYTATRTVTAGQFTNIATATGEDVAATSVSEQDTSHHFGVNLGIDIEKATNGQDADTPTGPQVSVGSSVTFTYQVSNTGNRGLTNVVVTDDNGTPADTGDDFNPPPVLNGAFNIGDTNMDNTLDTTEVWQYSATRTVTAGQHTNTSSVSGEGPTGSQVTDQDPSNHLGLTEGINIEKSTNGENADSATGPLIAVGSTANFAYEVSNTGATGITNVVVTDDNGTSADTSDDFNPAPVLNGAFNIGDTNMDNTLDTNEIWQYTATRTVTAGQFTNVATALGMGQAAATVSDQDPSNHFGVQAGMNLEKLTNGEDADTPTGPEVFAGTTVLFTYEVSNTGNVALSNVTVSDDNGTPADTSDDFFATFTGGDLNGDNLLDLSEIWTFSASRVATEGAYQNVGTTEAENPLGQMLSDTDLSNYLGLPVPPIVSKRRFLASS